MWPVLSKPSYKHVLTESKQQTNIYWSLDGTSLVWKFQSKGNIEQNCPLSGGCRLFLELYEKISIFLIICHLREEARGGSTVATSNWPIPNRKYHGYSKALFSVSLGVILTPKVYYGILCILCSGHTARRIGFTQIYSVQIWCKKVQTRGKSKAKMVDTAFACQFTLGCKF